MDIKIILILFLVVIFNLFSSTVSIYFWTSSIDSVIKCPLPALSEIIDSVENGKPLGTVDYYNMMYILYNFSPEILAVMRLHDIKMPEEAPSILTIQPGWEKEWVDIMY